MRSGSRRSSDGTGADFDLRIVTGVSTYAWELFWLRPELETVYVPIGMGSGVCGTIAARNALGLATKVVGVVSSLAPGVCPVVCCTAR